MFFHHTALCPLSQLKSSGIKVSTKGELSSDISLSSPLILYSAFR